MANLKFARGTTVPVYNTSGFDDGCIYFNTSNQNIYLRNGTASSSSTVEVFMGTDTKNTAGSSNTSSKIYLIGATSQATNPQTYSHDTAYVGTDGYLYSGGYLVAPIRSRTVYGTASLTGAASASDSLSIQSPTYGVVLYAMGERVGNLTDAYYYMPGTVTVTPGGGTNGPSYKITCTWTKKTGSGSSVLSEGTPAYTIYYIPRNYSS